MTVARRRKRTERLDRHRKETKERGKIVAPATHNAQVNATFCLFIHLPATCGEGMDYKQNFELSVERILNRRIRVLKYSPAL